MVVNRISLQGGFDAFEKNNIVLGGFGRGAKR
jgi:hypothetical protein